MYPSNANAGADGSNKEAEASKYARATPSSATLNETHGHPLDLNYQSSNPSAPLLPSSPCNQPPPNMEPPPYSSVVAQDSSDWKNRSGSSSAGHNLQPYPPAAPHVTGPKSSPGLDNQAPYPTGGYPSYGGTSQPPYPTGPGLASVVASQPPYPTGSGYAPGPASQPPYPTRSMPMPGPVDTERQIGFVAPVTTEPKSAAPGYPGGGWTEGPSAAQAAPQMVNGFQGTPYPIVSGENQYVQTPPQYVHNQYAQQQQQPNVVYVVQKPPEQNSDADDCCFWACCLASCYCLCECLKICAAVDS